MHPHTHTHSFSSICILRRSVEWSPQGGQKHRLPDECSLNISCAHQNVCACVSCVCLRGEWVWLNHNEITDRPVRIGWRSSSRGAGLWRGGRRREGTWTFSKMLQLRLHKWYKRVCRLTAPKEAERFTWPAVRSVRSTLFKPEYSHLLTPRGCQSRIHSGSKLKTGTKSQVKLNICWKIDGDCARFPFSSDL